MKPFLCNARAIRGFLLSVLFCLPGFISLPASAGGQALSVISFAEQNQDGRNEVCARFSSPLDRHQDIQSYFSVSKKDGTLADGAWLFSSHDSLACFANTEPATEYIVTIYKNLPGRDGARLANNFQQRITTRHLEPAASFDTRGSVLMPGISTGLPVVSVNVPAVDITFHRVRPGSRELVLNEIGSSYTYSLSRMLPQVSELVYTGRFALQGEKNRRVKHTINIADIPALQAPGLYLAAMKPAGSYTESPQMTHFMVTDLGLHARVYSDQLDVHINSLKSAQPVAGVTISLVDDKGQILQQARTTPEGYASFKPTPSKAVMLLAEKDDQQSLLRLKGPALDLSEFELGERPQHSQTLFIYSERDIYRPGETLHFNALLRDQDGHLQAAPTLKGRLLQPDGQVVRRFTLQATPPGFYQRNIMLPENASTGQWQLEIDKPDGRKTRYPFKVEEFLPERMKLMFTTASQGAALSPTQPIKVDVLGEYLYGAPAAGNRLSALLRVDHWRTPIPTLKDYQFGDVRDDRGLGTTELEDIFLDNQGKGKVIAPSRWRDTRSPLKVRLISSLYESGGRPVTRSFEQLVWPGNALIGIRPEFKTDENPPENSRVRFDIVRADVQGKKLAAQGLEITLIREEKQYFWEYAEGRGWDYSFSEQEYPVTTQSLNIAAGKHATVELPVEWGSYRLEVRDPQHNTLSSLRFFAGTDWYSEREASAQSSRPDAVGLSLDKPRYRAGDTALLTINPPHDGEALILVEADRPLWTHRQSVTKAGAVVRIPVDAQWQRHDIHVSVIVLRPASKVASITPNRAFGLLHLPLDREARRLQVAIDSVEKSRPNQPLEVALTVANPPVGGNIHVTLAAVDTGVLSLTDFKTPDPFEGFFGRRRYMVESRDLYGAIIELNDYPRAQMKFGGDAPARGGKAPASDIQIVSLYSGPVSVDAQGKAAITLDIPDFNGRLRLMAVAFGNDTFGHADHEVTIAAPVVTQLAMPRFIASGDQATLALDLHNMSGQPQTLNLHLTTTQPVTLRNGLQQITLADGEKRTLTFPISASMGSGRAGIHLAVTSESLHFERDWSLAVRPPYPLERHHQRLLISKGETAHYQLTMLDELLPQSIRGQLSISNQPDLGAARQMEALLQYPYGCLEQVSSSAWPWLYANSKNIKRLKLPEASAKKRLEAVEEAWRKIEAMQLGNGGFGLWDNHSAEEHWLTAYVTDMLLDAEAQGFPIQQAIRDAALKRLEAYLRQTNMGFSRFSENGDHYRFAYRSYAAYVLSRVNRANLGQMRSLFDHQRNDAKAGLPLVHLGLAMLQQGDRQRGHRAIAMGLTKQRDEEQYLADYGSRIRDDAVILRLLADKPRFGDQLKEKLLSLADAIAETRYLSTQERNALFLADIALQQQGGEEWQAILQQGLETRQLKQQARYLADLDMAALKEGIAITNQNDALLWSTLNIEGYPRQAPAPVSNGYEIKRDYYNREGKPLDISQLKVGDLVLVHLAITATKRMQDTLVTDLLPAGLELENQNLEHSIKLEQFRIDGKTLPELQGDTRIIHQEYRDDRYIAALDHGLYQQQSHIFYLARAVTPGTYKIPPVMVEDMYQPQKRAVGESTGKMTINK